MIGAWIDRALKGRPEQIITILLLVTAGVLIFIALAAPSWLKAGALVWAVAP